MKLRRGLAAVAGLALLCASVIAHAAPTFPALNGRRVVDDAGILSPATETRLTRELEALETDTGREMVVVTLSSLQGYEIADYGYQLGRSWGVGSKARNDGILLIVAPKERKVRIEVGYGLEGVLTDALSSTIIQTSMLPKFREDDLEGGIVSGSESLIDQLRLPDAEAQALAARPIGGRDVWWAKPAIRILALLVTTLIMFLWLTFWSFFSGLFTGWGHLRPREIRRRKNGLVDWSGGSFGGGPASGGYGGGGYSGGGGSFGGGGASGSW